MDPTSRILYLSTHAIHLILSLSEITSYRIAVTTAWSELMYEATGETFLTPF